MESMGLANKRDSDALTEEIMTGAMVKAESVPTMMVVAPINENLAKRFRAMEKEIQDSHALIVALERSNATMSTTMQVLLNQMRDMQGQIAMLVAERSVPAAPRVPVPRVSKKMEEAAGARERMIEAAKKALIASLEEDPFTTIRMLRGDPVPDHIANEFKDFMGAGKIKKTTNVRCTEVAMCILLRKQCKELRKLISSTLKSESKVPTADNVIAEVGTWLSSLKTVRSSWMQAKKRLVEGSVGVDAITKDLTTDGRPEPSWALVSYVMDYLVTDKKVEVAADWREVTAPKFVAVHTRNTSASSSSAASDIPEGLSAELTGLLKRPVPPPYSTNK